MEEQPVKKEWLDDALHLQQWAFDVFQFTRETMNMLPAEPLDELKGAKIPYINGYGETKYAVLFDLKGRLLYHDLAFYTIDMFKNQTRDGFREYHGTRFTWQQTVILTAYNRALNTFGMDSFNEMLRYITVRSGHGIGKTGAMSVIAIHFLWCFPGAQIGMTSNSEQQVEDIFMKEFYVWKAKLPVFMQDSLSQSSDHIQVEGSDDWFLRAQVGRSDKPEALAGLHAKYILILVDEASGVSDKVFEVMKGALTGENFIVMYISNPTRNEGEFFDSHKKGSLFTKLNFSSRQSPIVRPGYIDMMEASYPGTGEVKSEEVLIRVDGEFAGVNEMDDKGWIGLFANMHIFFEPERGQIINGAIIGVDPAGAGKDHSIVQVRDNIYLKEVLNEKTSTSIDLARKVETIRDAYNSKSNDIGVDAFGIGAEVVANIQTKIGDTVYALLTDKPREGTEQLYHSYKSELAWKFRKWVANGGIIITNNSANWLKLLEKIKYKRDMQGRIMLQPKEVFKKLNNFSPDRFDAAIHTFFKDDPTRAVIVKKEDLQTQEAADFMRRAQETEKNESYSSM